jgi:hypothetical protein
MSGYTTTPNYNLRKPIVGADNDAWGGDWNVNADTIDATMKANANAQANYLAKAGDTATGPVYAPALGMDASNVWSGASFEPGYAWSIRDGSGQIALALDWSGLLWVGGIAAPVAGNQPVPLSYAQANFIPITGGNMAGPLGLASNASYAAAPFEPGLVWSIRDANGNVALGLAWDGTLWVAKMQLLSGGTTPNPPFVLPTTPGASGTWWNNGTFVCVVP